MAARSSLRLPSARSRNGPCSWRTFRIDRCRRNPNPWCPSIHGTSWHSLRRAGNRVSATRRCCGWAVKDRGVDVDSEALGLRGLDRRHRAIEYARLTDRLVVVLAQPIEVDGEEEIRRWLE